MGFFKTLGNICSSVVHGTTSAVSTYVRTGNFSKSVRKGLHDGIEKYRELQSHDIENKELTPEEQRIWETERVERIRQAKELKDEAARKALQADKQELIDTYHDQFLASAKTMELNAKNTFKDAYTAIISGISEVINTSPIEDYVEEKSKVFQNVIRNEVNSSISIGSQSMTEIMDNPDLGWEEYKEQINAYVNGEWLKAQNKLLDLLKQAMKETNQYIRDNTQSFLQDELDSLTSMNRSLEQLSSQGAEREVELLRIAKMESVLSLISSLSKSLSANSNNSASKILSM